MRVVPEEPDRVTFLSEPNNDKDKNRTLSLVQEYDYIKIKTPLQDLQSWYRVLTYPIPCPNFYQIEFTKYKIQK